MAVNGQHGINGNISLVSGDVVKMKGINSNGISSSTSKFSKFVMTGKIAAIGNVMSLIDSEKNGTKIIPCDYCFYALFAECTSLQSAPELPATTLANYCYKGMFSNCFSLVTAPELPATTLTNQCYAYMFNNCFSLVAAPELPATTLAPACYGYMFYCCTSLATAPELPATTLSDYCYCDMFCYCSSLTVASELPALVLTSNCYNGMYYGTKITSTPAFPATTSAQACYHYMFGECTSLTNVSKINFTSLSNYSCKGMFKSCTNLVNVPDDLIMSTELAYGCYADMFDGCSKLEASPTLPALICPEDCYASMFMYCYKLRYIKCLATQLHPSNSTANWTYRAGESKVGTGIFVKHKDMTSWTTGTFGIPSGWTVQDAE